MSTERTHERAVKVTARIHALADQGYCKTQIVKITGYGRGVVERVMGGRGAFCKLDTSYLIGLPTVNDEAAREMAKTGWPKDERQTTEEIYAAAEAIREKRTRDPVGFPAVLVEVSLSTAADMNHRRWIKGLSR